jgi:GT2 family glycosyltransferase
MNVSIITSTYNRKVTLLSTLHHFYRTNTYPKDCFELIIINDGDDDLSDINKLFPSENIQVVKNRAKGLAAGRNTGSYKAKYDLLLYFDDDILIQPDHIQKHVDDHKKFSNAIVTCHRLESEDMLKFAQSTSFGRYKLKCDYIWYEGFSMVPIQDEFYEMGGLAGFSCSILKKDFLAIGDFNEKFPFAGNEDLDFYWRAKKKNYRLIFDKGNICFHNEIFNLDPEKWYWRQYSGMKSFLIFCELHPERKAVDFYQFNLPYKLSDSPKIAFNKLIRFFLRKDWVQTDLKDVTRFLDSVGVSDKFLFPLYNLRFIGVTNKAFREEFDKT